MCHGDGNRNVDEDVLSIATLTTNLQFVTRDTAMTTVKPMTTGTWTKNIELRTSVTATTTFKLMISHGIANG